MCRQLNSRIGITADIVKIYPNYNNDEDVIQITKLMKVNYYDTKAEIGFNCYADTVVIEYEKKNPYIAAIRLGGYPESVKGMSDAIFGGGSVTVDVNGERLELSSRTKQYYRETSHDGLYAEAVLRIMDEEQRQIAGDDETADDSAKNNGSGNTVRTNADDETSASMPRKSYIFCAEDDNEQLFEELDKKTAVPLIPEFQKYMLFQLQHRDILRPLQVISATEKFDAYVLHLSAEERNIIDVVNQGLRSGQISIPGAENTKFPAIKGVTQYLNEFGVCLAERIKDQFTPLFDPAIESLSPEVLAVNDNIRKNTGYNLYNAQLAVIEAHKRCLTFWKDTLCIAECGSGKSKIGVSVMHAFQQKRHFRQNGSDSNSGNSNPGYAKHTKHFNIVLCPSHMAKKWVREIEETLPNTFAVIVTSITELNEIYKLYEENDQTCYVILTKEKARDGYMRRPAVKWHKRRRVFLCPDCYSTIKMVIVDCGSKYKVSADHFYFRKQNGKNHKCEDCGSLLWTALMPNQQSDWVKVTDYGFVFRHRAYTYLDGVEKKPKIYEAISVIADDPDGIYPNAGAHRRYPLSTYIKNQMKGKIDGLVVDEVHNFNNNSSQGDAMGELFQAAKKVVDMTATLINGYSYGIFHLLYRISPDFMLRDNKSYEKPTLFNTEYGVSEAVYEIDAPDYYANRQTITRKIRERQLPGVSPLVYSRFLLEKTAFLSLHDMGKDLPEYEEIPIELEMNKEVAKEYDRIQNRFIDILKDDKEIAQKVFSAFFNLLTVYPDQPYDHEPLNHPIYGDERTLIEPKDTSSFNELHEKDKRVLEIVERKVENGERVLLYTSWIRIDTQTKLTKLLMEKGYRVAVLPATIPPQKREEWVEKQVKSGVQVLITNPSLVETGLDLNDFTTIIYYNIAYKLFTLRQSSRRSWRINQRAPRIEVYFLYYRDTMQHRAIRLMASKLAVAGVIEGNLTDEGLAAMSDCQDLTTALARELTQGIEGEVEDLSAVFKRMALLKPVIEGFDELSDDIIDEIVASVELSIGMPLSVSAVTDEAQVAAITAAAAQSAQEIVKPVRTTQSSGLMSLLHTPPKPKIKKVAAVSDGQLTLFDVYGTSA